jgi:Raf kinase inhibitor-like YbhB/YbcL family protein
MNFQLMSTAFADGHAIPEQFTADGRNVSPPLKWTDPPAGAKSLALVCEDPDAPRGGFTHWIAFNLPAEPGEIRAGGALPDHAAQGKNDFGRIGYGGPAPPKGKPHHYVFRLLALDRPVDLRPGATKDQFQSTTAGHVVGEARLVGTYGRAQ